MSDPARRRLKAILAAVSAKETFRQIIIKQSSDAAIHPTRFGAVAKKFLEWQELQVKLGRLKLRTHKEDVYKLQKDLLPFFQTVEITAVSIEGEGRRLPELHL